MTKPDRIDNFLAMHSTRTDSWRSVHSAAKDWAAGSGSKAATEAALAEIAVIEEFHAFPGIRLMNRLRDRLAAGEAAVVADLVRQYADAILTGRYTQMSEADGSAPLGKMYFSIHGSIPAPALFLPMVCSKKRPSSRKQRRAMSK